MAGTATNYDNTTMQAGKAGQLWVNLAIPAAASRITLDADGTPDSTANPNAQHLGLTREGWIFNMKPTFENYFADEFTAPQISDITELVGTLAGEIMQVTDYDILQRVVSGFGSYGSGVGYEEITFGTKAITYESIALIFPTVADPTKFAVYNLYRAFCETGIDALAVARKKASGMNITFRGLEIASRAAADSVGNAWKQV